MPIIKFAPIAIPTYRRRQTFGVLIWLLLLPISLFTYFLALHCTYTWTLALSYFVWIVLWDRSPETGGRRSTIVRSLPAWRWMRDFFPIELIKESDLDPSRNYIFGYHPHGIISLGAWINFATEANQFSQLFPGIHLSLLTLSTNFLIPIFREILLWLSISSVSRKSCQHILNNGPGSSVCIVIGGAQESLYARPGHLDLVLNKRLGFIKVALTNRASLVPVLSIGENDVYNLVQTTKGSLPFMIQQACKNTFGWTVPLFSGRGIFNYTFGLLPHRRRIATIVCQPIHPDIILGINYNDINSMSKEQLNNVIKLIHAEYVKTILSAWNKYKDVYAPDRVQELRIVE